ncbi:MAG: AAA family ATPase [Planctomycetia bacterium]|nr:AAA family ATPase [Planctomycetia bacterium]
MASLFGKPKESVSDSIHSSAQIPIAPSLSALLSAAMQSQASPPMVNASSALDPRDAAKSVATTQPEPPSGENQDLDSQNKSDETASESIPDRTDADPVAWVDRRLTDLFDRVNKLLADAAGTENNEEASFRPKAPDTLEQSGLNREEIESLILKFLYTRGVASGRQVCLQIKLPFQIVEPIIRDLKFDHLLSLSGTAEAGDFEYSITETGRDRARAMAAECSYCGAAPVPLKDYLVAMAAQSIAKQQVSVEHLHEAFADLIMNKKMLDTLGPAINSGRGMFLFGEPGNGKTSIAERITRCFGSVIWIPRALGIDGEIIRLFDPGMHEEIASDKEGLFDLSGVDPRWVQIVRPTIVAGGELTMSELEVTQNKITKICEAPLQLKSNCGTFVIDDFGRQRMPVSELLNRWIVPLEKRYDFLNMPSGKKIQVPFDQLIIFSTNLEPKQLVDGAFLRRIPYKIQVPDPTEIEFHKILSIVCPHYGFEYDREAVEYLLTTHYRPVNRPLRSCQPRDLVLQVRNYCIYHKLPKKLSREAFDFAVSNYFSVM